jgi:hypothetical protein
VRARAFELVNSLPDGQVGKYYDPAPVIKLSEGSTATVTTQQPLPPGMQIDNKGMLSGIPLLEFHDSINLHIIYEADKSPIEFGLSLTINANPGQAQMVSTGKKVEGKGTITFINNDCLVVDNKILIRFTDEMKVKYKKAAGFEVWQEVKYMGVKNTDDSITASQIQIKKI